MNDENLTQITGFRKVDRQECFYCLRFLANVAGDMGDFPEGYDDEDCYALQTFLYGIAKKVYPEWDRE